MSRLIVVFDRLLTCLGGLVGAIVVLVMLMTGAHVVGRYFLRQPLPWVVEFSEYALLFVVFLGSAWLLRDEGHVSVDVLQARLSPKAQALLQVITSGVATIVCIVVVWYGWQTTWDLFQRGVVLQDPMRTPKFIVVGIIPIGASLLVIQFTRRTVKCYVAWREMVSRARPATTRGYEFDS